jgi:hypothetical protein
MEKKISPLSGKINWGTGILIGIIIFILVTVTMTVIFMNQDVNLVTDKYYENSLQYQDEIDKQSRTNDLNEEVEINFNGQRLSILFPEDYKNKNISGEIYFYRPSNPKLDFKLTLLLSEAGSQIIPTQRLEKGFWRLKLNWIMNGNGYYNEKAITIE